MNDPSKDDEASQYEFTLYNSHPLLVEVQKRIPNDLLGPVTAEQIDRVGLERHGADWQLGYTNYVRQGYHASAMQNLAGVPATKELIEHILIADEVAKLMDELEGMRTAEVGRIRETVLHDLRTGSLIAACRGPEGFSPPLAAAVWHGTLAEDWLVTGQREGEEIFVRLPKALAHGVAGKSEGRFARACINAASQTKEDSRAWKVLHWFADAYPECPPGKPYSDSVRRRAEEANCYFSDSTFRKAWRLAKRQYEQSDDIQTVNEPSDEP
jgi:hypothetical protein